MLFFITFNIFFYKFVSVLQWNIIHILYRVFEKKQKQNFDNFQLESYLFCTNSYFKPRKRFHNNQ